MFPVIQYEKNRTKTIHSLCCVAHHGPEGRGHAFMPIQCGGLHGGVGGGWREGVEGGGWRGAGVTEYTVKYLL